MSNGVSWLRPHDFRLQGVQKTVDRYSLMFLTEIENMPKSVHMTFVHSCCNLGVFLGSYVFDRCCDLRGIIELGEPVLPWSMLFYMLLDVLDQVTEAFSPVVSCAFVVDIAEDPLNRIDTSTVCR